MSFAPQIVKSTGTDMDLETDLVPLRIDAINEYGTARIVDTILFDPSCWPVPLYEPLQESVERNVQELASTILADAEVMGVSRTARNFAGRTELWTRSFESKIADQIRLQLWRLIHPDKTKKRPPKQSKSGQHALQERKRTFKIKLRLNIHGLVINDDFLWDRSLNKSPILFAQEMGNDLNLPEEAVVAIATAVTEQINGVQMEPGKGKARIVTMADSKERLETVSHTVALHRPTNLDKRIL